MRKWINLFEYADPDKRHDSTFYQGSAHFAPKNLWERPGFAEWFHGSHVCAPNGQPLIAFHGSFEKFSEFKLQSDNRRSYGFNRLGFWFDIDPRTPEYFSGHGGNDFMQAEHTVTTGGVMPCVLSIKKPFCMDSEFLYRPDIDAFKDIDRRHTAMMSQYQTGQKDENGREIDPVKLRKLTKERDDINAKIVATGVSGDRAGGRVDAFDTLMKLLPDGSKSKDADVDAFRAQLIAEGHDGIYLGDTAADFASRDYAGTDWWIAFHPNQIKSIAARSFTNSNDIMK